MKDFKCNNTPCIFPNTISQVADMPYPLYLSLQGKYFVGFAPDVAYDKGKYGWAGLVNPTKSCIDLHVYVWTITNFDDLPLNAEIWFNANIPEDTTLSDYISPANTAIYPLPQPKVRILQANNVSNYPQCGNRIFTKKVPSEVTIVGEEVGRFIFPPGGSFSVLLSTADASDPTGIANVAFGWYEEEIK